MPTNVTPLLWLAASGTAQEVLRRAFMAQQLAAGATGHYRDTRAPPSGTCGFMEPLSGSSVVLVCVYLVHYLNEDLIVWFWFGQHWLFVMDLVIKWTIWAAWFDCLLTVCHNYPKFLSYSVSLFYTPPSLPLALLSFSSLTL